MSEPTTFVGMDVHKQDIAVAMLVGNTQGVVEWRVANEPTAVRRLAKRLQREGGGRVQCVYETGPCGYALQRQLQQQGVARDVVAPSMIPIRPGEKIKTEPAGNEWQPGGGLRWSRLGQEDDRGAERQGPGKQLHHGGPPELGCGGAAGRVREPYTRETRVPPGKSGSSLEP